MQTPGTGPRVCANCPRFDQLAVGAIPEASGPCGVNLCDSAEVNLHTHSNRQRYWTVGQPEARTSFLVFLIGHSSFGPGARWALGRDPFGPRPRPFSRSRPAPRIACIAYYYLFAYPYTYSYTLAPMRAHRALAGPVEGPWPGEGPGLMGSWPLACGDVLVDWVPHDSNLDFESF